MKRLRIGVNALYMIPGAVGGTEIYLRHLLAALSDIDGANEYFVFTNRETGSDLVPPSLNFHQLTQPVRATFRPARLIWEQTGLPLAVEEKRIEVLLNPGFTAPIANRCPCVTVFHDLQHKRHPEYFRWFELPFWRVMLYAAAHSSRLLLADSAETRTDLLRFYGVPKSKVRLAPLGVDPRFFEVGVGRCERQLSPYLLCASTLHPHKNLVSLIRAFAEARKARPELRLVITGVRGFHTEAVENAVRELHLEGTVKLTGWVQREELYGYFRDAYAFIYPSTFEGFGLPVLEAMAAGIPTACSSIEPLASLAGPAALQFNPADPVAMADALNRLLSDESLRERLTEEGPRRAAEFSWAKTAALTLDALIEASDR